MSSNKNWEKQLEADLKSAHHQIERLRTSRDELQSKLDLAAQERESPKQSLEALAEENDRLRTDLKLLADESLLLHKRLANTSQGVGCQDCAEDPYDSRIADVLGPNAVQICPGWYAGGKCETFGAVEVFDRIGRVVE